MIEIKPMGEDYMLIDCLHHGPVDPSLPRKRLEKDGQDDSDLPPHPWTDRVIAEVAEKYGNIAHGWSGEPGREFMRQMIRRYGTCAILAWENQEVVGHLRFYPMKIAQLLKRTDPSPILECWRACEREEDDGTLWVQCVMTAQPYVAVSSCSALADIPPPEAGPDVVIEDSGKRRFRTREEAGARRGVGQRLVQGLIGWAREHGWKRIVKVAHCDLDWFYGIQGGGGRAFWEKAGFKLVGSFHKEAFGFPDNFRAVVEAQMVEKGMTWEDVWTWYRMAYEL